MSIKAAIIIMIVVLPFAGWIHYRDGQLRKENESEARQYGLLEKLNIEPVKKILAPDFHLKDLGGNSIGLHDLRGKVRPWAGLL